jgi:hypothetical protein
MSQSPFGGVAVGRGVAAGGVAVGRGAVVVASGAAVVVGGVVGGFAALADGDATPLWAPAVPAGSMAVPGVGAAPVGVAPVGVAPVAAAVAAGGTAAVGGGEERSRARTTRAAVATPAKRSATPPRARSAMFTLRGVWVTMVAFPREAELTGSPGAGYSGAVTAEWSALGWLDGSWSETPDTWESLPLR